MKDCCKTGDEKPDSEFAKWTKRVLWGVIIVIVIGVTLLQIL